MCKVQPSKIAKDLWSFICSQLQPLFSKLMAIIVKQVWYFGPQLPGMPKAGRVTI